MAQVSPTTASTNRLSSIDFMRGLVIVIMALDHIRDLLHTTSLTQDPTDLHTTTPFLFFTRWITHFCAPTFVCLAGVSAFLMAGGKNDLSATRRFLFSRGLWLMFLEVTVIGFGFWADIQFRTILFQVIFAIGAGFVILSTLIGLPSRLLGGIGLAIIFLHDLLPQNPFAGNAAGEFIWALLFERGFFKLNADHGLIIGYALIPWLGVMLLGFGLGEIFTMAAAQRRRILLSAGIFSLALFLILRGFNLYGDPRPWSAQVSPVFSLLSFLNVSKYPPSLLYIALTLSLMFFVLYLSDEHNTGFMRFFMTYGRVPMFFYLLHWYLVHASMFVMILLQGATWQQMQFGTLRFGRPETGVGLELPGVYLYWVCLILCVYPLCRWYGRYKAAHRDNKWLSYL